MADKSGVFNGARCGSHNMMKRVVFTSYAFTFIGLSLFLGIVLFLNHASDAADGDIKDNISKIEARQEKIKEDLSEIKSDVKVILAKLEKIDI